MRTFRCSCGDTLFFDNTSCDNCGVRVGFCPVCRTIVPLHGNDDRGYTCGNPSCGCPLIRCYNYRVEGVCNRCIAVNPNDTACGILCDCCRYNQTIPDLTKEGNRQKWRHIEAAKRRLFYQLDLLGLPHGNAQDGFDPPLSFDFKEDFIGTNDLVMHATGEHEVVTTGHLAGKITINIREADPVERERIRVQFNEPHRSLIGHFRHEMAHYYWDLLVRGKCEQQFKVIFGNYETPTYTEALDHYYKYGPVNDWAQRYPSAYASMHPWEDFAECFAAYLEMVGSLDTAHHTGLRISGAYKDFDDMLESYRKLGVAMNVMNRTMGLKDHLARPLPPPVIEKMKFIHTLVSESRSKRQSHAAGQTSGT